MGTPIVCPHCRTKNGLLLERCRKTDCYQILTRDGLTSPDREKSTSPASWETLDVSTLRDRGEFSKGGFIEFNWHDFFRHYLLLRAMKEQFNIDDDRIWFDDCIFFLRGGFNFFVYLNLTSKLAQRGRIFGGLNHARRPRQRLAEWLRRIIYEARARGFGCSCGHGCSAIDIFIAEEINSGSSTHGIRNLIQDAIEALAAEEKQLSAFLRFHFYLAGTDSASIVPAQFTNEMNKIKGKDGNSKRIYIKENIMVENHFRFFQGPLFTYDAENYSGLRVETDGSASDEIYKIISCETELVRFQCPDVPECSLSYGTGGQDLASLMQLLPLDIFGFLGSCAYQLMGEHINRFTCNECKRLYNLLRTQQVHEYKSIIL